MSARTGPGPRPAEIAKCRSCGADIYWVKTKLGKNMPVNVVPTRPQFRGPNSGEFVFVSGEHESHFSTCPQADQHRMPR